MSHHHHRHHNEPSVSKAAEPMSRGTFPLFDKNDLAFLAVIKPLLSPSGQKLVDLVLLLSGSSYLENPPDIMSLLSQLNTSENNNAKELLISLLNSANNPENKANPNLAMLASLLNSMNQKNNPEDS